MRPSRSGLRRQVLYAYFLPRKGTIRGNGIVLTYFSLLLLLLAVWFVFSGFFNTFFIVAAVICCLLAVLGGRRFRTIDSEGHPVRLLLRAPIYWLWLFKEMAVSSLQVARIVWQPKPKISPTLATLPCRLATPTGQVTYANSITLTPGTVCLDVNERELLVHALRAEGIADLREGGMQRRVQWLMGEA